MTNIGLGLCSHAIVRRDTINPTHSIGSTNRNHQGQSRWNLNENMMERNGNGNGIHHQENDVEMISNDRFGFKLSENLFVSVCTLHHDFRSLFAVTFPLRFSLSFIVCMLLVWSSCKTIPFSPVFSMVILSSFRSLHFHSLYTLSVDSLFCL